MAKRKIAFIAQCAGGVEEYLYMFFRNYKDDDTENFLIVSEDYKNKIEKFKPFVNKIYIVPMIRELSIKEDIKSIIKIRKILKEINPDIVYMHSSKAGGLGRIALLFNRKIKKIYNAHGWYFNAKISQKKKIVYQLIEKILAYSTDIIVNISINEYESAINKKIAAKTKMTIIENGIDFTKFIDADKNRDTTRKKYCIDSDEIVIGVVGRLSEQKDPLTTIKAFKNLNEKHKNTKLFYVGSGDLEEEVREYSKRNNIENNVIITGWVGDVEKYIPAFDIAILPSKWEGFGLAIVEYMACKKPIVATKTGGIANIIDSEERGFLIETEDYQALSDRICYCIENKELVDKMAQSNFEYAKEKFNIKNVIKKHEEIFNCKQ